MLGRPPVPVIQRINKFLPVDILPYMRPPVPADGDYAPRFPDDVKDQHWIWQGKIQHINKIRYRGGVKMNNDQPARIRDSNGEYISVIRILHREIRGFEFVHSFHRSKGCNFLCVNPFHLSYGDEPVVVPPDDEFDDIAELADEIGNFIGTYGRNKDRILEHFGLDYSVEEIEAALRKVE